MEFVNAYMNYIVATLAILAALVVAILIWRTLNLKVRGRRGQRLGISEYHELDKTRRLVLVRRDNIEHLILIGGQQDVVIEQGIGIPGTQSFAPRDEETQPPIAMRAAPRPPVFGDRRPPLRSVERDEPKLAEKHRFEPEQS
ncbi:MAG: hypothetical protein ACT4SY_09035 [Hyphomicrobiales bacterium]